MEWSLTPNRSIRGAAPYDTVVQKFLPGYANIPAPKSDAVRDAAHAEGPIALQYGAGVVKFRAVEVRNA